MEETPLYLNKWMEEISQKIFGIKIPITDLIIAKEESGMVHTHVNPHYLRCYVKKKIIFTDLVKVMEGQLEYYQHGNPVFIGNSIKEALVSMVESLRNQQWMIWANPEVELECLPIYILVRRDHNNKLVLEQKSIIE
tara:strand:+ start:831 stop:1241 length:411 start_codon:yes stop_codon:yes gene_type:complete